MTQATLNLRRRPSVTEEDVEWLSDEIKIRGGSPTARDLAFWKWGYSNENQKRIIREMASQSKGRVIGTQDGYVLTKSATDKQWREWIRGQENQRETTAQRIEEARQVRGEA